MGLSVYLTAERPVEVFEADITHNLTTMAEKAGLYMPLWRPEEIGVTHARDLSEHLEKGLKELRENKVELEKLNPENGWGSYENLLSLTKRYLEACNENPDAVITAER